MGPSWQIVGFRQQGMVFLQSSRAQVPTRSSSQSVRGVWILEGHRTDKPILAAAGTNCIGVKKALVFYKGRPPKGIKTDWVMHEYRVTGSSSSQPQKQNGSMRFDDWVLCRVRKKGNFPAAGDEVTETCSPTESSPAISRQSEEKSVMENSCFSTADLFCNDDPLLDYNVFDFYEGRETAAEALDPVCSMRYSDHGGMTVYGAWKRKLSVGLLDESMLQLQPGKRVQCSPDGLLSTASSVSANQFFPDFFL
ncbi:NAC transcription factor NAM-B2 [Platanthera guangdongensis]|uniref:NAC transcription factor NAM-B2 n=1 Tax=Platanthera guangdongensis TaxID=2320717 RepID=A0ABR2LG73_9ASPA